MILEKSIDIWDVNIVCKSNLVLKPTDLPYAHLFRAVNIPLDDKSMRGSTVAPLHTTGTTAQPHTLLWVRTVRTVRIMVSSVSVRVYAVRFSQLFDRSLVESGPRNSFVVVVCHFVCHSLKFLSISSSFSFRQVSTCF